MKDEREMKDTPKKISAYLPPAFQIVSSTFLAELGEGRFNSQGSESGRHPAGRPLTPAPLPQLRERGRGEGSADGQPAVRKQAQYIMRHSGRVSVRWCNQTVEVGTCGVGVHCGIKVVPQVAMVCSTLRTLVPSCLS